MLGLVASSQVARAECRHIDLWSGVHIDCVPVLLHVPVFISVSDTRTPRGRCKAISGLIAAMSLGCTRSIHWPSVERILPGWLWLWLLWSLCCQCGLHPLCWRHISSLLWLRGKGGTGSQRLAHQLCLRHGLLAFICIFIDDAFC